MNPIDFPAQLACRRILTTALAGMTSLVFHAAPVSAAARAWRDCAAQLPRLQRPAPGIETPAKEPSQARNGREGWAHGHFRASRFEVFQLTVRCGPGQLAVAVSVNTDGGTAIAAGVSRAHSVAVAGV